MQDERTNGGGGAGGADAGNAADTQGASDADRAELAWLIGRESDPGAPPPSRALAREHAQLEALLGSLPAVLPEASWRAEMLRKVREEMREEARQTRRRVAWRWAAGTAALVAAAVALVLMLPRQPEPPAIEWSVSGGVTMRDGSTPVVGQRLKVEARPGDLRLYREDGTLLARCPSGPNCTSQPGARRQTLEIDLDRAVPHHVILVLDPGPVLPDASMNDHLAAATTAGRMYLQERIGVR